MIVLAFINLLVTAHTWSVKEGNLFTLWFCPQRGGAGHYLSSRSSHQMSLGAAPTLVPDPATRWLWWGWALPQFQTQPPDVSGWGVGHTLVPDPATRWLWWGLGPTSVPDPATRCLWFWGVGHTLVPDPATRCPWWRAFPCAPCALFLILFPSFEKKFLNLLFIFFFMTRWGHGQYTSGGHTGGFSCS